MQLVHLCLHVFIFRTILRYRIMAAVKVETDIITSTVCEIRGRPKDIVKLIYVKFSKFCMYSEVYAK
jgi:hypothetical protein